MFNPLQLLDFLWADPAEADYYEADIDDTILCAGDVVTLIGTNPCVGEVTGVIMEVDYENAPYCYRVKACVCGTWQAFWYRSEELEKQYN